MFKTSTTERKYRGNHFSTILIQGSSLRSTANGEMVFNLPMNESKNFPALFESLEQNKRSLDFLNLGISVTTMEDVFLRSGNNTIKYTIASSS